MSPQRLSFIDWMKCLGILVIVYGHVAGPTIWRMAPPICPKQLGVAFFLFVAGFSLAREQRGRCHVLFNRLFEIVLFGVPFALLMSALTYAQMGRLALSNYLPFLLGANVPFDNFPANPTTWYIGTYLHILLLWALFLRGRRVGPGWLVVAVVAEVLIRAALMPTMGLYPAYMALTNWMVVFLLGMYYGQRPADEPRGGPAPYFLGLALVGTGWSLLANSWPTERTFPFLQFTLGSRLAGTLTTSFGVTLVYLMYTWFIFQVTRRIPVLGGVQFCARNTVVIFIFHMPIYFALMPPVLARFPDPWTRIAIWFGVCFFGLLLLSELLHRLIRPRLLRDKVWSRLTKRPLARPQPVMVDAEPAPEPSELISQKS